MTLFAKLDAAALRVLGSLMEKEMTTPDTYPLSLAALEAAANQRSSRDPVMELDEEEIRAGLSALEVDGLVARARDAGRVPRYEHRIRTVLALRRDETALLCLLLLRGPQTVGELRGRSDRLFAFDGLDQVQAALDRMAARQPALAEALPRQPGSREARYRHLLGTPQAQAREAATPAAGRSPLAALEDRVVALEARLAALEASVEASRTGG